MRYSKSTFSQPAVIYFRLLVTAAGVGMLLWSTWRAPQSIQPWFGLFIAGVVALQLNFPFKLLRNEFILMQVVSLGGGLLYGAATAGWAAALGILAGWTVRSFRDRGLARREDIQSLGWLDLGFTLGRQELSLLLALHATGHALGLAARTISPGNPAAWISLIPPLLIFALTHGVLLLVDFLLQQPAPQQLAPQQPTPQQSAPYPHLKRDLVSLGLVELLPMPFVLLGVLPYPYIGNGSLLGLSCIPVIISFLLNWASNTRQDLDTQLKGLSAINQVSQILRSTLDLENLLNLINQQVSQLLGVDNFYVALYNPREEHIWYPLAVKHGKRQNWRPRPLEDRLTDRVILDRKPFLLNRQTIGELASTGLPPSEETPAAWIGVPLVSSDRAIGCLALFSFEPQAEFTARNLELLNILSGQISVAIENALLFEQAQRRTAQMETLNQLSKVITASLDPQEVLAQVCRSATEFSGGRLSAIYLLDQTGSQVWLAHTLGLSQEFVSQNEAFSIAQSGRARCLRTGRPALVSDLQSAGLETDFLNILEGEQILAFGDFPLITPEGQIGFLSVYFDVPHVFSMEETELLQTYASQAALALANARLYARTDLALSQRAHQLSILEAIGRELSAAIQSEQLFDLILGYAQDFTHSPWGSFGLFNQQTGEIEIKASRGYQDHCKNYPVERGISGRAVRDRQTINAGDIHADPDYIDLTGGMARSQLSIPLVHEGRVLGVVTLEHPQENGYSQGDVAFINQLANQAAIAVVNANLYSETQRRLREQSTLYQVSAHLAGTLELKKILHTIRLAIRSTLTSGIAGLYLWDETRKAYILQAEEGNGFEAEGSQRQGETTSAGENLADHLYPIIPENELAGIRLALAEPTPLRSSAPGNLPDALRAGCQGCQVTLFPLAANRQRLGMVLFHTQETFSLQEEDLKLLQAIITQGEISIQNAQLFSDVTRGRDRLAAVLDSVGEGILLIEAGGRITLANQSVQTITGLPAVEIAGKSLASLGPVMLRSIGYTPLEAQAMVDSLGAGHISGTPKIVFKTGESQSERYVERSAFPVWGDARAIGWMIVLRDVSEENQIAQAREIITETLVHDLRSPLSAVIGSLELIEEDIRQESISSPIISQALHVANRSSRRIQVLIESLLDISRMQSGSMELDLAAVNLYQMLETTLADFIPQANEYGLIIRNEVSSNLPLVCADAGKLTRVLTNLLDNALKFTPFGGQILLAAELQPQEMVAVKVGDTGAGVPEEYRDKIFERFTQIPGRPGRRRGSGLGLTFCRLAIEAHGGRIWVEARPGGGSNFIFTLPVATEGKAQK